MRYRHTVVFPQPSSPVSKPMPLSSMRWPSLASASRRALDSNSSSVSAGVWQGQAGEGEVSQVHQSSSLRFRRLSGERGGSGAGSSGSVCVGVDAALDRGIGVGVEAGGKACGLCVVHDAKRPVGRRLGVVAQDDVLADENGVGLVESSVQADGAVLVYAALGLEEEEVEVCGGVAVAHGGAGERPLLEGRAALEAAMGGGCCGTCPRSMPRGCGSASGGCR